MPAYHYRFHPAIRSARAAVTGGSVGLPWAVHAEFVIAAGTAAWPLGELLNFGLYAVDAMRAVLALEVRSVYATVGTFFYDGDGRRSVGAGAEYGARRRGDDVRRARADARAIPTATAATDACASWARTAPSSWTRPRRRSACTATDAPSSATTARESLRALVDHFIAVVRGEQRPSLGRATRARRSRSSLPRATPPRPTASSHLDRRTAHETRDLSHRDGIRHGMLRGEPEPAPSSTSVRATCWG